MPRYKLIIEYDGTPFSGWQAQENGVAVQALLQKAVKAFSGETVTIAGAGRTDAGVHALGQVAHLDLGKSWPVLRVRDALNAYLRPHPVSVVEVKRAAKTFDARFSAKRRVYSYKIVNRTAPLALERERAWHIRRPLDEKKMQKAANYLIGKHDFTTFRNTNCQAKSPMKNLDVLSVRRAGEEIIIEAEARSFLHNQIRSIVGSLKSVGEGKHKPAWIKKILDARDRKSCGALAPACGLTLMRVDY